MVSRSSTSTRPGELSEEFRKLFNLKQTALFTIPCGSDTVQTPLSVSNVSVASSISTTEGLSTTSVPVSSLVSRVDSCRTTSVSTPSSITSVLTSSSSTTSSVVCSSPSVVEEEVRLGRDGILGQQGECLSASKLGELSSKLVHDFVFDSVAPGTLKIYSANWQLFRSYGKISLM